MDKDLVVHRFKTSYGRSFQCLMAVEVKTLGAKLSESQRDTLHMLNQMLRNRQTTPTKKRIPKQLGGLPKEIWSTLLGQNVRFKAFGYHLLRLSGKTPDDSEMWWDNIYPISKDGLIKLLRFDLDPDTLEPMDWRKHHAQTIKAMELFPTFHG